DGAGGGTRGARCGDCWTGIEDACPEQVLAHRDVEGRSGGCDQERTETEPMRQVPIADQHHTVSDIKPRPPITLRDVVRIHDQARTVSAGVGIRVTERVKSAERKLSTQLQAEVGNQLVLVEEAAGLEIVDVSG